MRRTSYQKGSLRLADRKKGKVWEFLWREVQLDGTIRRKHIVIGTQEDLPTESSAQAVVDAIRLEINQQTPQRLIKSISFETLVNHYRQHELPDTFNKTKPGLDAADEDRKSYSTQVTYEGYLKKWILPRWRACRLTDVKATEVEKWLKSLCFPKTGVPLARGSRAKIRNIMSAIYSHAIRWEWTEKNPITKVRQSAKRQKAPDVLTPEEIMAFLKELPDPLRTMIELDAFTGLRRGELIGLRWQDVDFENLINSWPWFSKAPMSILLLTMRWKPRWSVVYVTPAVLPAARAGLPGSRAIVGVGPPLFWRMPRPGLAVWMSLAFHSFGPTPVLMLLVP